MTDATPVPAAPPALASDEGAAAAAIPVTPPPLDSPLAGAVVALWLRELRGRMRGRRAFVFITIYLVSLAGILYAGLGGTVDSPFFGALEQVGIGRGIFTSVILIETLVVVALAPAYTAGTISQEREKQTFDLLAVTPVSSLAIVIGKLLSGVSYLALVVGASIPLASLAFLFGGLGIDTVLQAYLVLGVMTLGIGAIGVACSALMRRTQPATVAAFMIVSILVVGSSAAWLMLTAQARAERQEGPPEALIYLNPFFAEADLLCETTNSVCIPGVTSPFDLGVRCCDQFGNALPPTPEDELAAASGPRPGSLWPKSVLAWLVVGSAMILLASQVVHPNRRWRPGRRPAPAGEPVP